MDIINKLALFSISFYQKRISPKKGYSCAYSAYYNDLSCSSYCKKEIQDNGLILGVYKTIDRLKKCKQASSKIKEKRKELKSKATGTLQEDKKECQNMDGCEKLMFAEAAGEVACCALSMFS